MNLLIWQLLSIGINKVQFVGIYDGIVIVLVYNWFFFFEWFFKRVLNIKKYYYFWFFKDEFGRVYFKEFYLFFEQFLMLLKDCVVIFFVLQLLVELNLVGLS